MKWLEEPTQAASLALLPLRPAGQPRALAFGMLVLASPDTQRYQEDMATDFLERIAEIASAALSRLTTPGGSGTGTTPSAAAAAPAAGAAAEAGAARMAVATPASAMGEVPSGAGDGAEAGPALVPAEHVPAESR